MLRRGALPSDRAVPHRVMRTKLPVRLDFRTRHPELARLIGISDNKSEEMSALRNRKTLILASLYRKFTFLTLVRFCVPRYGGIVFN